MSKNIFVWIGIIIVVEVVDLTKMSVYTETADSDCNVLGKP